MIQTWRALSPDQSKKVEGFNEWYLGNSRGVILSLKEKVIANSKKEKKKFILRQNMIGTLLK